MRTIIFLLFFPFILQAQSNFKKGYVVTFDGDTLNGYINYKERAQNPGAIIFKRHLEQSEVERFDVQNAKAFAISGYEAYERFITSISMDEVRLDRLDEKFDSSLVVDTVFLRIVVKGDRVSLYAYKDQIKERFYTLENGAQHPIELVYKAMVQERNEIVSAHFKQQLTSLAIKYGVLTETLNQDIQSSMYVRKHLTKIISGMNTVTEKNYSGIFERKKRTSLFVGTGVYLNKLDYTGKNFVTINRLDANGQIAYKDKVTTHSVLPRFSAGIDYYLNPVFQRYLIRLELFTSPIRSKTTSYYRYGTYLDDELENQYQLSTVLLSVAPQFICNLYNRDNFKFYLGAGGAFSYVFVSRNNMHKTPNKQGQGYVESSEDDYFKIDKRIPSLVFRSGVVLNKRIDLSLVWMTPADLSKTYRDDFARLKASSMHVSIAYIFKNKVKEKQ